MREIEKINNKNEFYMQFNSIDMNIEKAVKKLYEYFPNNTTVITSLEVKPIQPHSELYYLKAEIIK